METKILHAQLYRTCIYFLLCSLLWGCGNGNHRYDATGLFESDEIIVSSQLSGQLIAYTIEEGAELEKDSLVGRVDPVQYQLQSEQFEQSIEAIEDKTMIAKPQVDFLNAQKKTQVEQLKTLSIQLESAAREKARIEKLFQSKAATAKQMDDVKSQYDVLEQNVSVLKAQIALTDQQIRSYKETISRQNQGIISEQAVLDKRKAAADDLLRKSQIRNPIAGTVLSNFVHAGEWVNPGKPLYKIAKLDELTLRIYLDGTQLLKVQLGQTMQVIVQYGKESRTYTGQLTWVSDKAEFTPKTIQTVDERANLVYAAKVKVKNDGYLKLGMFAEVKF